ncbi:hypothetical protein jhhlp_003554 [Lomentospora prolificans]|uniref:ABC transporter domain-containing protein n=1 Tax=Lomentospora prolificans TaxID=41688 RepID=A0A2N3N930_9PEZI|nr:hypothetical protein jhhlp_003554 [Lomentospora prolificans]
MNRTSAPWSLGRQHVLSPALFQQSLQIHESIGYLFPENLPRPAISYYGTDLKVPISSSTLPWIHRLGHLAELGHIQVALILFSLLSVFRALSSVQSRGDNALHQSNCYSSWRVKNPIAYELISVATQALTAGFLIVSVLRDTTHWSNAAVSIYTLFFSLVRVVSRSHWRFIGLHQANFVSFSLLILLVCAHWLPCIQISTVCHTRTSLGAGSLALVVSLALAFATPREWPSPFVRRDGLGESLLEMPPSPEETCSWLSYYCSYEWFTPTIWRGSRSKLQKEKLPSLPWYDHPALLLDHVRRARVWGKNTLWTTLKLAQSELALMTFWISSAFVLEVVPPFALYMLLDYIDNPQAAVYHPWVWLAIIFLGPTARSVTFQQYIFTSTRIIVRIKSAFTQELYHRLLESLELEENPNGGANPSKKGNEKQIGTATGRIANMISSDIDAIFKARDVILVCFATPLNVTASIVGLYRIVGWPSLVAALILVTSIFFSIYTARAMARAQFKIRDAQDSRISLISEYLSLIKAIKYFSWERFATAKIQASREFEQRYIWRHVVLNTLINVINSAFPYAALLSILFLRVIVQKKPLPSSVAFTTVALVKNVRSRLNMAAFMSRNITAAIVAFKRLDSYYDRCQPLQQYPSGPLCIQGGSFSPSGTASFKLQDINIEFVENGLNVVTGQSGCGKTTLLLSLLGETIKGSGLVTRPRDVGYAPQTAWLLNDTIKKNIILEEAFEAARYRKIIECCCLEPDFDQLLAGDQTLAGENGTTLSGGQRARVGLARALYSKASVLLLDDIFSALDAKTAAKIWELSFCSDLLKGRTVVLVTQVPWIAAQSDLEIMLENGQIKSTEKHLGVVRKPVSVEIALATDAGLNAPDDSNMGGNMISPAAGKDRSVDLVNAEMQARGAARMVYGKYIAYWGHPAFVAACVVMIVIGAATVPLGNLWLAIWTEAYDKERIIDIAYYLGVYAAIIMGEVVLTNVPLIMSKYGGWVAARTIHGRLVQSVMNVSLTWYTDIPIGRVVNRFSRDIAALDNNLSYLANMVLWLVVTLIYRLASISSVLPVFIIPSAITCFIGLIVGEMYTRTGVVLRRLDSSTQSPVFSQFADTLTGLAVIRAREGMPAKFGRILIERLLLWSTAAESLYNANRWVGVRIDLVTSLVSLGAGIIALTKSDTTTSGLIGFSLLNATGLSTTILLLVRSMNDLEVELQSFDRLQEYLEVESEDASDDPLPEEGSSESNVGPTIPRNWPSKGEIEFRDVAIRYDLDGPDILSNINLKLRSGERVAVIGRTGSGKSTLVLSLLRFTHIVSGTILYDGLDITKVPRRRLREALTIIPQEPVLFSGTVGSNLDPTGSVPEAVLQKVIQSTKSIASFQYRRSPQDDSEGQNSDSRQNCFSEPSEGLKLSSPVSAKGENFSHGQRQVLSLCRALVRKSKLMLLDEATANMDHETDRAIQEVLSREVEEGDQDRSLVTIAHRLTTILNYDRVVVMGDGKILETGNPRDLYKAQGHFYNMVQHGGDGDAFKLLGEKWRPERE